MADTIARQILAALAARLEVILPINGYNTDAGERIYLARQHLVAGEDTLPALCLYLSGERVPSPGERRIDIVGEIIVEAHVADSGDTAIQLQELAGDLKTALFPADESYRYVGEGGQYLVQDLWPDHLEYFYPDVAGQTASLRFTLTATWPELVGDPYTII